MASTEISSIRRQAAVVGAKIALPYLLVATLWILLSDALVTAAAPTPQSAQWLQTWKGWIYVLVTAGLLYALVTRYARRVLTLMEDVCASERRFRRTIEMVPDIIYRACPADLSRSFMNARATVLGFSIEELDADPSLWNRQIHDDDRERVTAAIRRQLGHGMRFAVEYRAWHKDGATLRWFKDRGVLVEQENGNDAVITGVIEDITELRAAERQIAYLSNHDPLTGLINQRGLLLVLETKLRLARRDAREVSCLCLGIDNFHRLNSVYGRLAGDAVLARVAEALQRVLRARDTAGAVSDATLARTESDRFLIALPDTNLRAARAAGQRLISELGRFSTELQGQAIPVHLRIGVATFPDHARDAGGLVSHAEFALERAREHSCVGSAGAADRRPGTTSSARHS